MLFSGWGIGIRTPTNRVRVCRATVTLFPNVTRIWATDIYYTQLNEKVNIFIDKFLKLFYNWFAEALCLNTALFRVKIWLNLLIIRVKKKNRLFGIKQRARLVRFILPLFQLLLWFPEFRILRLFPLPFALHQSNPLCGSRMCPF